MTLTLPRLGETMEEARVTDWLVAPGTAYKRGDVLLEVETDKTVVEVPALSDGTLIAHLVHPGDTVALDQPIAEVEAEGAVPQTQAPAEAAPQAAPVPVVQTQALLRSGPSTGPNTGLRASPRARAAVRAAGIALTAIHGTGRNGRITAADVALRSAPPTAMLLHGLFDSPRSWADTARRLDAAGYAVIAPDLPGHGDARPADSLDAAAETLVTALPDAGPVTLIGHSAGAAVAVTMATRLGPRLQQLVLIAPAGLGAPINADFLRDMLAADTPATLATALRLLDTGPMGPAALATEFARIDTIRTGLGPIIRALASADIRPDLARLTCDIRVIWGTADQILPWQTVANLPPHAAIHLVAGAGHLPHHAAPALVPQILALPTWQTETSV